MRALSAALDLTGATRDALLASARDAGLAACAIAEALGLADISASDVPRRARAVCEGYPTLSARQSRAGPGRVAADRGSADISHDASIAGHPAVLLVDPGHAAEGLRWYQEILKLPSLPPAAESRTLFGAAVMYYALGEHGRARAGLDRALARAQGAGEMDIAAHAGMAVLALSTGDGWARAYAAGRTASIDALLKDIDDAVHAAARTLYDFSRREQ